MSKQFVYGSYPTTEEAHDVAKDLTEIIPAEVITIVGEKPTTLADMDREEDYRYLSSDSFYTDEEDAPLDAEVYAEDLENDYTLILLDEGYSTMLDFPDKVDDADTKPLPQKEDFLTDDYADDDVDDIEDPAPGPSVRKRIIEEDVIFEVPLRREELAITHQMVADETSLDPNAFQREEITIHVSNERASLEKVRLLTEEVDISNIPRTESEEVDLDEDLL